MNNNVLLIKSIVKRFIGKGVEYDDLYQLGCVGFLKAIKTSTKIRRRFSTYAVPMIIGEIKRFLRDDGTIKISRIIKSQAQTINRYVQERSASGGEPPTLDEICAALNMEREDVVLALDSTKMPLSLHESVDDGSGEKGVELIDKIPSPEKEDDMVDKILLKSLIEKLPEREKK